MSLLSCRNLSFSYEGNEVLSEVNFNVNAGDYLCIVGENGAGKSTLMKGILGLKRYNKGEIVTGEGLLSNEIGYLPQQTQIQKDFPASVYEVVRSGLLNTIGMHPFYGKKEKEQVKEVLALLGLEKMAKSCYRELSGGQQQRVLLARALLATKKVLVMDEPVTGFDPIMTKEFYELTKKLNKERGITIIMVSHDMSGMSEYVSHVLHLGKKQLFFGSIDEYKCSEIGKRFLGGISDV